MFADSSSSGPIFGKNPSTYSRRDARRARKRGGPSAESCVRCLLLFSRTTLFSHLAYKFTRILVAPCIRVLLCPACERLTERLKEEIPLGIKRCCGCDKQD